MANNIQRFIDAMNSGNYGETYNDAIKELQQGRKTGCWIWYCLPMIYMHGVKTKEGHIISLSSTAKLFSIQNFSEAVQYVKNDLLRNRLLTMFDIIYSKLAKDKINIEQLMGSNTDAIKLKSCVTLFNYAFNCINFDSIIVDELYKLLGEDTITTMIIYEDYLNY